MAKTSKKTAAKVEEPKAETKAEKFARLASARVSKALKTVSLIGNLSGSGYEYTDEQVAKIRGALTETVNATMQRFVKSAAKKEQQTFTV